MTVVKSVNDGLEDSESETQLSFNRPLRISAGPRHLSRSKWPADRLGCKACELNIYACTYV
jgi:hypothetical protein